MVALTSSDVCLTVALACDLVIFNQAGTRCVAGVSEPNRSVKVAVAGKTHVRVIRLLFRVFVEAFQAKLAMDALGVVLAFVAYTSRCVSTCLQKMQLHKDIQNGIEIWESQITEKTLSSK